MLHLDHPLHGRDAAGPLQLVEEAICAYLGLDSSLIYFCFFCDKKNRVGLWAFYLFSRFKGASDARAFPWTFAPRHLCRAV